MADLVPATSVPSEASRRSTARVDKPIDAVLPLIELATLCCTHCTASPCDTTPTTSSNTSSST